MTVLELQQHTPSRVRWTEVCATEHAPSPQVRALPALGAGRRLPASMPVSPGAPRSSVRSVLAEPRERVVPGRDRATAPRRAVPAVTGGVRSCRREEFAPVRVVDDVPTWVLAACGVVFGLMMVLALAFVGGPAYA